MTHIVNVVGDKLHYTKFKASIIRGLSKDTKTKTVVVGNGAYGTTLQEALKSVKANVNSKELVVGDNNKPYVIAYDDTTIQNVKILKEFPKQQILMFADAITKGMVDAPFVFKVGDVTRIIVTHNVDPNHTETVLQLTNTIKHNISTSTEYNAIEGLTAVSTKGKRISVKTQIKRDTVISFCTATMTCVYSSAVERYNSYLRACKREEVKEIVSLNTFKTIQKETRRAYLRKLQNID